MYKKAQWKPAVRHLLRISELSERMQIFSKKVFRMFGTYAVKQYFCTRFRERNADELKYWNRDKVMNNRSKNFLKIFSWKVLVVQKKSLPLHPLSERKPLKKSSLKDLDINKQVVQKAYLGK